ncbi:MAG TPA: alkyl sulfatase dimerization domain-containing protein [Solirubrobacterales bacterium]|nr:alkyl sulfatase dimerization domain-containing protein [Solirubrobacterales bacterium]
MPPAEPSGPKAATASIEAANSAAARELPFDDRRDFDDARRGFVTGPAEPLIRDERGEVVWDMGSDSLLDPADADSEGPGGAPPTVHPALWRQARLNALPGLYEVADGVYQARGFDISNMSLIEGESGVIVVDPLISTECAAAALALYRAERGGRAVSAVVYTHSHVDHFGGVEGVVDPERVRGGEVPVWAPEGFLEHAVSENVLAGTAMARRAAYMFGSFLEPGERGRVDCGIGRATSAGTVSLIPPTDSVTRTRQRAEIDGVNFVFQLTPDTEAPAELNFQLPQRAALCVAENATHTLHNLLTLRGAPVRDALRWSKHLDETRAMFADSSEVVFHGHHWPTWGSERIAGLLARHRDLYRYLHDQTLRLLNAGLTPTEIAAELELPPELAREWSCRPLYGTVSHNVRAIYQRYLGFFDGNPAHLDPLPPVAAGRRYVELAGGADALLERAGEALAAGEFRWAAELASHLVFADPRNRAARELEADALEQLGYGSESAIWRNHFLAGARELRDGVQPARAIEATGRGVARALPIEMVFDAIGARLDGPRAAGERIVVNWRFTDLEEEWTMTISNGALSAIPARHDADADALIVLTRSALDTLILGGPEAAATIPPGEIEVSGDGEKLARLLSLIDRPDPGFEIVAP